MNNVSTKLACLAVNFEVNDFDWFFGTFVAPIVCEISFTGYKFGQAIAC